MRKDDLRPPGGKSLLSILKEKSLFQAPQSVWMTDIKKAGDRAENLFQSKRKKEGL
jgi:hypothetical protein